MENVAMRGECYESWASTSHEQWLDECVRLALGRTPVEAALLAHHPRQVVRPGTNPPDERAPRWFIDNVARVHVGGAATGGRSALVEVEGTRGDMPALHVHHRNDETFYVLDGTLTLFQPGSQVVVEAGSAFCAGRGIPHVYRVESETARWLAFREPAATLEQVGGPPVGNTAVDPSPPGQGRLVALEVAGRDEPPRVEPRREALHDLQRDVRRRGCRRRELVVKGVGEPRVEPDSVHDRVRACRLDGRLVHVQPDDGSEAELDRGNSQHA
jgi:quercetin dioxygenase-like cupin family protein